jgi:integrase
VQETQRVAAERPPVTFGSYADTWLAGRQLRPRTRELYRRQLDRLILPNFGTLPLDAIRPADVRAWHAGLDPARPTQRAHAYSLLRTICATAVDDELLASNPCRIRGAGTARRQREVKPATLAELTAIAEATPERFRAMVLLSGWCGLRFGEVVELRRRDIDLAAGTVRVERAVSRAEGRFVVGDPKTAAGRRTVAIPPHLLPAVREHLARWTPASPRALLFATPTGGHLAPSTVYGWFYPAREAAGRPDLRWHDLRHTGAVLAAATGATLAELMARLGHSTPAAAMIYQHAAQDRDRAIAEALSEMAGGTVVPLRSRA